MSPTPRPARPARPEDLAGPLASALAAGGVREVVVSPGSRSTPLVLAFAALEPAVRLHVVLDERAAAFVALGLARASGRPPALVCTSGTAGGHYLPAVLEASASRLPLLLLTADRPPELHGCGSPQAIDQRGLLGRHVRVELTLGPPAPDVGPAFLAREAARALDAARAEGGPVHLNVAFREPLWTDGPTPDVVPAPQVLRGPARPDAALLARLGPRLGRARRGAIVCGPLTGAGLDEAAGFARAVTDLGRALGWPVLADPLSRVRWGGHDTTGVVAAGDALLRCEAFAAARAPDVVLRFGRVPTAKPIQAWLARAEALVVAEPTGLCRSLLGALGRPATAADWLPGWRAAEAAAQDALRAASAGSLWGGAVARLVLESLPAGGLLHVASSLPVRDLDLAGACRATPAIAVGNRGVNGIDGTIATAAGEALAGRGPVVALTGDLAFLHDLGGLLAASGLDADLTVVVVDNGGGAIFDQLPIAAHPTAYERFFLTPQAADLAALCRGVGAGHARAADRAALRAALADRPGGLRVIEVPLERVVDGVLRRAARDAVARAVAPEPRAPVLAPTCARVSG